MNDIVLFRDGDRTHRIPRDCYVHLCGVDDAELLAWSTSSQQYLHNRAHRFKVLSDEVELWLATTDICDRVSVRYQQNDVYLIFKDSVECTLFKMAFNIT